MVNRFFSYRGGKASVHVSKMMAITLLETMDKAREKSQNNKIFGN
jgi:hypothetical protein